AMAEAAAGAARVAMTGFNWRFPAAMRRFNAMVQEGALGRVFHVHARFLGSRFADEAVAPTWRMDRAEAGHGAMGDMGVHLIDLVRWNFGEFVRLAATGGGLEAVSVSGGIPAPGTGDQLEVLGLTTIAPLVACLLEGIEGGQTPAPSFGDGYGAQAVLDAVLESLAQRAWVAVAGAGAAASLASSR